MNDNIAVDDKEKTGPIGELDEFELGVSTAKRNANNASQFSSLRLSGA